MIDIQIHAIIQSCLQMLVSNLLNKLILILFGSKLFWASVYYGDLIGQWFITRHETY